MIVFPNAKINIGLRVTGKRSDGFHNIDTVFYPIPLCDELEFIEEKDYIVNDYNFSTSGISLLDCLPEQNLCIKAYKLIAKDFKLPKLKIHLHKIIPSGAGLGGGSADASFMVKALNSSYNLGLSDDTLKNYAAQLGSDCAFFIENKASYATEKGNVLSRAVMSLYGYTIVIIHPGIHVSTAEAFANVQISTPEFPMIEIIRKPIEDWKECIVNDFEKYVFKEYPEIMYIKEKLYESGAIYSSMSGSGSAVYGIFDEEPDLENIFPASYFIWKQKL